MSDPKQIAAKLTEAQRAAILGPEDCALGAGVAIPLIQHGLIEADPHDSQGWRWSLPGLAVRAILTEQHT